MKYLNKKEKYALSYKRKKEFWFLFFNLADSKQMNKFLTFNIGRDT